MKRWIFLSLMLFPLWLECQVSQSSVKDYWFDAMGYIDTASSTEFKVVLDSMETLIKRLGNEKDSCAVAYAIGRIGVLYSERNLFLEASMYFEKALEIWNRSCPQSKYDINVMQRNMAYTLNYKLNEKNAAISYYQKGAIQCFDSQYCDDVFAEYIDLVHSLGQFDRVLDLLEMFKSKFRDSLNTAIYFEYKGNVLSERKGIGDIDLAIKYGNRASSIYKTLDPESYLKSKKLVSTYHKDKGEYQKAIAINESILEDERVPLLTKAAVLNNQSNVFRRLGDHEEAFKLLIKVKAIYEDDNSYDEIELSSKSEKLSMVWDNLNEYYLSINKVDSAVMAAQVSLSYMFPRFSSTDLFQNPSINEIHLINLKDNLIVRLYDKFRAHKAKFEESNDNRFLESSLEVISILDRTIDVYRWEQKNRGTLLAWRKKLKLYFNEIIAFLVDNNEVDLAFHFMEKSKSILLSDALPVEPDIHFSHRQKMNKWMRYLREKENKVNNEQQSFAVENELDSIRDLILALQKNMGTAGENYFENKYQNQSISLQEAQAFIEKNQVVIEYHLLSDGELIALVFDKNNAEIHHLDIDSSFFENLSRYNLAMKNGSNWNDSKWPELSYQIYQSILEPLKLEKNEWIIIPDGVLSLISFPSLIKQAPQGSDIGKFDYIIKSNRIQYQPTLSIAKRIQEESVVWNDKSAIFAPVFDETVSLDIKGSDGVTVTYKSLAFNRKEGEIIADIIGGELFSQGTATKHNFLDHIQSASVIHVPTHGMAFMEFPDLSHIVLEGNENPYEMLYLKDIYSLKLKAELLALSACETGIGRLEIGEGISSLGRGFMEAGAKSVLQTSWVVDDKSTFKIMQDFYAALEKGIAKDDALRTAQIEYLKDPNIIARNKHPHYWAPYTLYGDTKPIGYLRKNHFRQIFARIISSLGILFLLYFGWRYLQISHRK